MMLAMVTSGYVLGGYMTTMTMTLDTYLGLSFSALRSLSSFSISSPFPGPHP